MREWLLALWPVVAIVDFIYNPDHFSRAIALLDRLLH